jgi:peptide/nickel transport system substrate-binding protein
LNATAILSQAHRYPRAGDRVMKRRQFLAGSAGLAMARPAVAQRARLLRYIPQADLANPDPVWSTATLVGIHSKMIYDTLYALDESFAPRPQMAAGHEVSSDGLTWIITLRDGLFFHDGERVRAADCVPSILRASKRGAVVETLMSFTNELTALDDNRLQFRLKKPFPLVSFALDGVYIMPERVARTDAFTQISEYVGSGPLRFLRDEWKAGSLAAYERFDKYKPRDEPISMWAGGKVVNFDRIEWHVIPDPSTAAAALQNNEADWLEDPLIDIVPSLKKAAGIGTGVFDTLGSLRVIQFNHYQPPFDNVKLRRAVLAAVNQQDFVDAQVGDQTDLGRVGVGFFPQGSPYASSAGMDAITGKRDLAAARRMVAESGYKGEPIVLMSPSDQASIQQAAQVAHALYLSLGLNSQYTSMDWGTLIQRRNSNEPPERGGWNSYATGWVGLSVESPATSTPLRCNGAAVKAWLRPTIPEMERLRDAWFDAPDLASQKAICERMQVLAFQEVPFIPTGQTFSPTAFRSNLSGFAKSPYPVFWGVKRT